MKWIAVFVLAAVQLPPAGAVSVRGASNLRISDPSIDVAEFSSASALEDSIVELLKDGNTPALAAVLGQMRRLIEDHMKPEVRAHRSEEQRRLDALVAPFQQCAVSSKAVDDKIVAYKAQSQALSKATQVAAAASAAEKSCKKILEPLTALQMQHCSDVEQLVKQPGSPGGCPLTTDKSRFLSEVAGLAKFYADLEKTYNAKTRACAKATSEATEQSKKCELLTADATQKKQAVANLEASTSQLSCSAFTDADSLCKAYPVCYDRLSAAFDDTVSKAKKQEAGLKTEFESIRRMECLADIFSRHDTMKSSAIQDCRRAEIDVSEMSLRYPVKPRPRQCTVPSEVSCPAAAAGAAGSTPGAAASAGVAAAGSGAAGSTPGAAASAGVGSTPAAAASAGAGGAATKAPTTSTTTGWGTTATTTGTRTGVATTTILRENAAPARIVCGTFTCPSNTVPKNGAGNIVGSDASTCCDAVCSGFSCPVNFQRKGGASGIRGSSQSLCCDAVCSGFQCAGGFRAKSGASFIVGNSKGECCDQVPEPPAPAVCSSFNCGSNWQQKVNAGRIVGQDQNTCCDRMCSAFQCGSNFALKSGASSIRGDDQSTCCQPVMCDTYTCKGAWTYKKSNAASIQGASDAACCDVGGLVNGDFELGANAVDTVADVLPLGVFWKTKPDGITGWTSIFGPDDNGVPKFPGAYIPSRNPAFTNGVLPAAGGNFMLGLKFTGSGVIQKVKGHVPGRQYTITFYATGRPKSPTAYGRFVIDGVTIIEGSLRSDGQWQKYSYPYTARSSTVEFKFENTNPLNLKDNKNERMLFVDAVSIQ